LRFPHWLRWYLSSPQNVADPVPYIISGLIPIEGQIHLKILAFMYNIFLLSEDSTEKKIARRQLAFKDINSNSWFTEVKSLLWKYDLPEIYWLLESPYTCILYAYLILTVVVVLTMDLCIFCRGQHLVFLIDEHLVVY
jgi:hypothetical protein